MGDSGPSAQSDQETTNVLLSRVRDGDDDARDLLIRRFLPRLRRWAHGRIPRSIGNLHDTDDLVQVTFLKALDKMKTFDSRHRDSFLAYLRRILLNEIVSLVRGAARRPSQVELDEGIPETGLSPLEEAIGRETLETYERALARLPADKQEAVFLRIEMGYTHEEVAAELDLKSADAARMLVARALVQLSEVMRER